MFNANIQKYNENIKKLEDISKYKHNWNGYGAEPFSTDLIEKVKHIIENLEHQPQIFPTANNSIQLEYDINDTYLEFEILESGEIKLFKLDGNNTSSVEYIKEEEIAGYVEQYLESCTRKFIGDITIDDRLC